MKVILFIIVVLLLGCTNKPATDAEITLREFSSNFKANISGDTFTYQYRSAPYKVIIETYSKTNSTKRISSYLSNNPNLYSSFFKFEPNGKLAKYYFMAGDGVHDLYRITYNADADRYEEQGDAYVDNLVPGNLSDTTNNYTLIFSTFPRKNVDVSYSIDKVHFHKLPLLKNNPIPFVNEGDLVLSKKELKDGVIIKVKAENLVLNLKGIENIKETTDTLHL